MPMTRVHDDSMLQLNGYERAVLSGMRGSPEGLALPAEAVR
jgi:hypothetical protein